MTTLDARDAETLLRLAAVAGASARSCSAAELAGAWRGVGAVVVDEDSARRCVASRLPRRGRLLVVTTTAEVSAAAWSDALALGADAVLPLAEAAKVAAWLAGLTEPVASGRLVSCLSARGGSGASTLAAALALAAGAGGDALLIDADPAGGGLDYLLGIESVEGARWPELCDAEGVLPASALAESLPAVGRVRVLAMRAGVVGEISPPALQAVVEAGLRGHAVVVADVGRSDPSAEVLIAYADLTVLVVPCEVRAAVAAAALARDVATRCSEVRLVLRPGPGDLRPSDVSAAVGAPVAAMWPWERRLDTVTDAGDFHRGWRRSRVAGIATDLLAELSR